MAKDWKEMERVVAKKLGNWWGTRFQRTPSSGAWSKNAHRGSASDDFHGDIVAPPSANFPFSVECKAVEEVELYKSLYGMPELFDWWIQCTEDALRAGKRPMLIVRENRKQNYLVAISTATYNTLQEHLNAPTLQRMTIRYRFTPAQWEFQGRKKVKVAPASLSGKLFQIVVFDLDNFTEHISKDQVSRLLGALA